MAGVAFPFELPGRLVPKWALRNYLNQVMIHADNPPRKEGYHGQEESRTTGAADHLGNSG